LDLVGCVFGRKRKNGVLEITEAISR